MSNFEKLCSEVKKVILDDSIPYGRQVEMLRGKESLHDCISKGLSDSLNEGNWLDFNAYTVIAGKFPSVSYGPILSSALDMLDSRVIPGEVLLTLRDIADPRCVPSVRMVLFWKPDWDEFHDLAFKALDVLLKIDNEEAWAVIEEAARDDRELVRDSVSRLLRERSG